MPLTYDRIATTTLGSAQTSVTFSSISGSYTDLRLIINGALNTAVDPITINVNSDTGSNYSYILLYGNGSSALSTLTANLTAFRAGYIGTSQSNTLVDFMNYSNTATQKAILGRGNIANWGATAQISLWRSTVAITSMTIQSLSAYSFISGSTFTLYGIKAA
jgi:hypothetical protein